MCIVGYAMTDAVLSDDELIKDAGIDGIGSATAQRLEAAGIASVGQLAEADVDQLAGALARSYPTWKPETLRHRVGVWGALARERLPSTPRRTSPGHVFLLTIWTGADGRPVKSRFGYRSPVEPASEETSQEVVGWSPIAFTRFVQRRADLSDAHELTEEQVHPTEVLEWSKHLIEGVLVRGGEDAVVVQVEVPTDQLRAESGRVRWRASGRLVPFGGGPPIALGKDGGSVEHGESIELAFAAQPAPQGLYRAWFDMSVSPPTALEGNRLTVADRSPELAASGQRS